MPDTDYSDDLALLTNTPTQALLHNLEQASGGIGLYLNANKSVHVLNKKEPSPS